MRQLTALKVAGNFVEEFRPDRTRITPKRVALVACPWTFVREVEFRSQQLGLGYVGAYAQSFGHQIAAFVDPMIAGGESIGVPLSTRFMKTNRYGHPDAWIAGQIPADVEVIGINAPFTDSRLVLYPLVRLLRQQFPAALIVVGGILATTLPRQILENCPADIVVQGEGEIAFVRILNGDVLPSIPGILFRSEDGAIIENPGRSEQLKSVAEIPPPGYDFRPMPEYVTWSPRGDQHDRTLSLISSRGCPFTCEFCSIPEKGQRWRPFDPERVLAEIREATERWGVNHIEFEDDNFTLQEPRALAVLEHLAALRRRGQPVSCSFPNGIMIDRMTPALAELLMAAGSDIIYLPVESGHDRVLVAMDKPNALGHLDKTLEVARFCVEAGLTVSTFFIVGYPGGEVTRRRSDLRPEWSRYLLETEEEDDRGRRRVYMHGEDEESFEITLGFCRQLRAVGVAGITPLIATPYPGTELYHVCDRFGYLRYPDDPDVLVTVSYAHATADNVQISTPWCSHEAAYARWQAMMAEFPAFHNVRKAADQAAMLHTQEVGARSA